MHLVASLILCSLLAIHGLRKGSLSASGAIAAFALGLLTFTHPHPLFSAALLTFYLSSSTLTKLGAHIKANLEEDHKVGGERTAVQVFSNGFTGTLIACLHRYYSFYVEADFSCMWDSDHVILRALLAAYIG